MCTVPIDKVRRKRSFDFGPCLWVLACLASRFLITSSNHILGSRDAIGEGFATDGMGTARNAVEPAWNGGGMSGAPRLTQPLAL